VLDNFRIRKIGSDGIISTIIGNGSCGYSGNDGPAAAATICPGTTDQRIAVGKDGSLYFADPYPYPRIRRVGPDGIVRSFAGSGVYGYGGDGGPASGASLGAYLAVCTASDGAVFISDYSNNRVRRVGPDGIINTVAGNGTWGSTVNGAPATGTNLVPWDCALRPDGSLIVADGWYSLFRIAPQMPGSTLSQILVPSPDAREAYVMDSAGRHLQTIDATTNVTRLSFSHDANGRLIGISDQFGNTTRIERDGAGIPIDIVAPYGQRTYLAADAHGYLSSVTNPAGETFHLIHDDGGLLTSLTDPRSNVHRYDYDALGRLLHDNGPTGQSRTLVSTNLSGSRVVTSTTALGRTSSFRVTQSDERIVYTATSPPGLATVEQVLKSGVSTTTYPDGSVYSVTPGPDPRFGTLAPTQSVAISTPGGLTGTISLTRTAQGVDRANPLSFSSLGETVAVNGRSYFTYRDSQRVVVTTPAGRQVTMYLDQKGRVTQVTPPGVSAVSVSYDGSGRVSGLSQGSRSYSLGYDGGGNLSSLVDPMHRTWSLYYDLAGRIHQAVLPGTRSVTFGYDAGGNLSSLTPPGTPDHGFASDAVNRLTTYTPPLVDGAGSLVTINGYDLDGALSQVALPDSSSILLGYDTAGRLSSLATWRGSTTIGYDTAGRVGSVGTPENNWVMFAYDGFLRTSETATGYAPGTVSRAFNSDFQVTSVSVNGTAIASFQYDADGLIGQAGAMGIGRDATSGAVNSTTLGVLGTVLQYTAYGELSSVNATANGAGLYSYSLSRDASGRISGKQETISGKTTSYTYGYDAGDRLSSVSRDGTIVESYSYDANGNRLSGASAAGSATGTYDAQDRMTAYGAATYTYGPAGDLRTKTAGRQATTYSYDSLGNLMGAWLPDGRTIEYVVDGLNRRVGKKVNGAVAEGFLYDGQLRPVAWLDGAGNVKATFVYGLHVNVPEYMNTSAGTFRILTDHLGSPRLVVSSSTGALAQRMDYDSFGNVLSDTNPGFQPFGFAGGLYDRDTGLVRFGARDYDPSIGRWTNKDPIRFAGGLNLYAYVDNDPVNFVDSSGRWLLQVGAALIGGAIGGVSAYLNNGSTAQIIGSVLAGAGAGLLASFGATPGAAALWGAVGASSGNLLSQLIMNKRDECGGSEPIDWSRVWLSGMFGLLTGGFGPGIAEEAGTEVATLVVAGITGTLDAMTPNWILYQNAPQQ